MYPRDERRTFRLFSRSFSLLSPVSLFSALWSSVSFFQPFSRVTRLRGTPVTYKRHAMRCDTCSHYSEIRPSMRELPLDSVPLLTSCVRFCFFSRFTRDIGPIGISFFLRVLRAPRWYYRICRHYHVGFTRNTLMRERYVKYFVRLFTAHTRLSIMSCIMSYYY